MIYDSHTHLNDDNLYKKPTRYLNKFVENWWKWLVNVGINEERNQRAINLAKDFSNENIFIGATIWYHPGEVCFQWITEENKKEKIENLKKLYQENSDYIVAIWECGIDTHYPKWFETLEFQKEVFDMQCSIAKEYDLPIVIHSRDDFQSTFDVVKNYKELNIYFHCWGYGPEEVKKVQNTFENVWIWYAGNVTYPQAVELKESLKITNEKSILMETDAPYLAPSEKRGKTSQPYFVKYVYEFAEEFLGYDSESFRKIIENNFKKVYNL